MESLKLNSDEFINNIVNKVDTRLNTIVFLK